MHIHFIGIRAAQYSAACKIWGKPDFVHKWHDHRAYGDIDTDTDIVVIGTNATLRISKWAWQDHAEN